MCGEWMNSTKTTFVVVPTQLMLFALSYEVELDALLEVAVVVEMSTVVPVSLDEVEEAEYVGV